MNKMIAAAALVALSVNAGAMSAQTPEPQPRPAADHRSPAVAGVLSAVVPGVGSFYAGNAGHGVRHVLIMVGADVAVVVGLAQFASLGTQTGSGLRWFLVGMTAYAVNDVWSIFTAVGDAKAYNAAADRRAVGRLSVEPRIRILGSGAGTAARTTVGLEIVRVAF